MPGVLYDKLRNEITPYNLCVKGPVRPTGISGAYLSRSMQQKAGKVSDGLLITVFSCMFSKERRNRIECMMNKGG